MNKEQKWRYAELLFDAIGQIEDRYIAEAEAPYVRPHSRLSPRRWIIVAATLSLAVSLSSALLIGNLLGGKHAENEAAPDGFELMDQEIGALPSLDRRLEEIREDTEHLRTDAKDVDLFDGTPRVIWQYADEENCRSRSLSKLQLAELTQRLSENAGTPIADTPSREGTRIWIAMGDGTVISPCLAASNGNVGYGSLFTYQPELEPSPAFSDLLCDILSPSE